MGMPSIRSHWPSHDRNGHNEMSYFFFLDSNQLKYYYWRHLFPAVLNSFIFTHLSGNHLPGYWPAECLHSLLLPESLIVSLASLPAQSWWTLLRVSIRDSVFSSIQHQHRHWPKMGTYNILVSPFLHCLTSWTFFLLSAYQLFSWPWHISSEITILIKFKF